MRFIIPLLPFALLGCSAIFDFDSQCESSSDCAAAQCVDGVCVVDEPACVSHLDCDQTADLTGTELCIEAQCTQVLFETEAGGRCFEVFGELAEDPADNVIVPLVISVTGNSILYGNAGALNGARMAVRFANDSGSLGTRRGLVIACDDTSDPEVSKAVAERILDATGAHSMLGPSGDASQEPLVDVILPRKVLTFTATTAVVYANLVDDDLAFRTYPSDQLVIDGLARIRQRFSDDVQIGMLYRSDAPVRRILAESVLLELGVEALTEAYDGSDPADVVRAGQALADRSGSGVDVLFLIGIAETKDALTAYRDGLPDGFTIRKPAIFTDAAAALNIPQLVAVDGNLTPQDVNAVVGAAVVVEPFERLYQTTLGTTEDLQLAALFYDAAMLTFLTHVAAPNAVDGRDLSRALRALIAAGEGPIVDGADGVRAFAEAGSRLAVGAPTQYLLTAGGVPARFDARGDIPFPVISGTFLDDPPTFFIPTRLFNQGVWMDACFEFNSACAGAWIAGEDGPQQTCVDIGQGELGVCLPQCGPELSCPGDAFECAQQGEGGLCQPRAGE